MVVIMARELHGGAVKVKELLRSSVLVGVHTTVAELRQKIVALSGRWVDNPAQAVLLVGGKKQETGLASGLPAGTIRCVLPAAHPCGICQEPITAAAASTLTFAAARSSTPSGCGHKFCFGCITEWCRNQQNTCPHCRERVASAACDATGEVVKFETKDLELEDDDTEPNETNPDWVPDRQVKCFGHGTDNACKWRNGEFDRLSLSEQLEREAENCSIECDECSEWFHIHCVGFSDRTSIPSEDVDWHCPLCVSKKLGRRGRATAAPASKRQRHQPKQPLAAAAVGSGKAKKKATQRRQEREQEQQYVVLESDASDDNWQPDRDSYGGGDDDSDENSRGRGRAAAVSQQEQGDRPAAAGQSKAGAACSIYYSSASVLQMFIEAAGNGARTGAAKAGTLSLSQLQRVCDGVNAGINDRDIQEMFTLFDTDSNGLLNQGDFGAILQQAGLSSSGGGRVATGRGANARRRPRSRGRGSRQQARGGNHRARPRV